MGKSKVEKILENGDPVLTQTEIDELFRKILGIFEITDKNNNVDLFLGILIDASEKLFEKDLILNNNQRDSLIQILIKILKILSKGQEKYQIDNANSTSINKSPEYWSQDSINGLLSRLNNPKDNLFNEPIIAEILPVKEKPSQKSKLVDILNAMTSDINKLSIMELLSITSSIEDEKIKECLNSLIEAKLVYNKKTFNIMEQTGEIDILQTFYDMGGPGVLFNFPIDEFMIKMFHITWEEIRPYILNHDSRSSFEISNEILDERKKLVNAELMKKIEQD